MMQVNNQLRCLILYRSYLKRQTISKMHLLKLKTLFRDKVIQNQDVCETMVLRGSPKDELKLKLAYFDLTDINHTVLHNLLWFRLMKATKNKNELTFSFELFQDDYPLQT